MSKNSLTCQFPNVALGEKIRKKKRKDPKKSMMRKLLSML